MEIDIQNLSFNFKTQNIFENTTVSFAEGKISFIMAPNGRGKTTLLKLILGSLHASQGLINNSAKNNDTYVLFDNLELYKNLTGMDNILFLQILDILNWQLKRELNGIFQKKDCQNGYQPILLVKGKDYHWLYGTY